jgi:hypothetical protein
MSPGPIGQHFTVSDLPVRVAERSGQKNDGSHYVIDLPAPIRLPATRANRGECLYSRGFAPFAGKKDHRATQRIGAFVVQTNTLTPSAKSVDPKELPLTCMTTRANEPKPSRLIQPTRRQQQPLTIAAGVVCPWLWLRVF